MDAETSRAWGVGWGGAGDAVILRNSRASLCLRNQVCIHQLAQNEGKKALSRLAEIIWKRNQQALAAGWGGYFTGRVGPGTRSGLREVCRQRSGTTGHRQLEQADVHMQQRKPGEEGRGSQSGQGLEFSFTLLLETAAWPGGVPLPFHWR